MRSSHLTMTNKKTIFNIRLSSINTTTSFYQQINRIKTCCWSSYDVKKRSSIQSTCINRISLNPKTNNLHSFHIIGWDVLMLSRRRSTCQSAIYIMNGKSCPLIYVLLTLHGYKNWNHRMSILLLGCSSQLIIAIMRLA